jgi:1-acyl-sn-glycerol-3-phosphate acyltransferase
MRYRVVRALWWSGVRLVYPPRLLTVTGVENIPAEGPLLVVSNHLSIIDPVLYGALFPRNLFAMAKREIFPNRFAAWVWAGCNTFPVDRHGHPRAGLKIARRILAQRGRLLLFIEGSRAPRPGMTRAEKGAALLVRESGCRVLPAAVWGTESAWPSGSHRPHRVPVHLHYGAPFLVPADMLAAGRHQAVADYMAAQVAALLPAEYRGCYGAEQAA